MDIETALHNCAKKVRELRLKNNYTHDVMCEKLQINRRGYQLIEYNKNNDIKLSTVLKIMDFYNISFDSLFGRS